MSEIEARKQNRLANPMTGSDEDGRFVNRGRADASVLTTRFSPAGSVVDLHRLTCAQSKPAGASATCRRIARTDLAFSGWAVQPVSGMGRQLTSVLTAGRQIIKYLRSPVRGGSDGITGPDRLPQSEPQREHAKPEALERVCPGISAADASGRSLQRSPGRPRGR